MHHGLVFEGSLRKESLNARLASLAQTVIEENSGGVDRAHMAEFDCPSFDFDVVRTDVPTAAIRRARLHGIV